MLIQYDLYYFLDQADELALFDKWLNKTEDRLGKQQDDSNKE